MEMYSPPLTRARARALNRTSSLKSRKSLNKECSKPKSRSFDTISKDTSLNSSSIVVTDQSAGFEVKKVKLSKDELEMNGAPTGDIFDIKVLLDSELTILSHPQAQIDAALLILLTESPSWADRYGAIEVLRRSTVFSPALLTPQVVGAVMSALSDELESLRSCTLRNSVLCLESLLQLPACREWVQTGDNNAVYDTVIGKLLLKSCSGPKFLCKIVLNVLVLGAKVLPFSRLSVVLTSFSSNKNSDVCNIIYVIGCDNFLRNMPAMVREKDVLTTERSLRLFQKGLSSVQPVGRGKARSALRGYADKIGAAAFREEVARHFTEDQCNEIDREVKKSAVAGKTPGSARVPLRPLNPSSCSNTEVRTGVLAGKTPSSLAERAKPWAVKKIAGAPPPSAETSSGTGFIL